MAFMITKFIQRTWLCMCIFYLNYLSCLPKFGHRNRKKIKSKSCMFRFGVRFRFGFGFGAYVKAHIGFKAFYFLGSVSVRFRCICEMAFNCACCCFFVIFEKFFRKYHQSVK